MPVAIIDTNVIVAGVLSGEAQSLVCRIVDGMLAGKFVYALSPPLLAEYRAVLLRPRIRKLHGWSFDAVDIFLEEIVATAVWHEPCLIYQAPDPDDDHLWSLIHALPGSLLVTGDQLLLRQASLALPIMTPRDFIDQMGNPLS